MAENKAPAKKEPTKAATAKEKSQITMPKKMDIQFMEDADGKHAHSMRGFTPRYKDFIDYILGITHEIWEEKAIGKLYEYYANTIHFHTSSGTIYGREKVFLKTIEALAAFPDRRLYGDDVIWGGNDIDGLYSSHRVLSEATNRGWSHFGPPTGKRVKNWSMANCLCRRNMVVEEWVCRDELAIVLQLGLDPVETAKTMNAEEADSASGLQLHIAGDVERGIGQYPPQKLPEPKTDRFDLEHFVRRMIHEIWNWRLLNKAYDYYQENFAFVGPTMREFTGVNDYQTYVLSLLSPFPDLAINIDHFCYVGDERAGYRTATRWTMRGTHTGYGIYGEPSGNPIRIIGTTHHIIKGGRIENEWSIFDEFALLRQILL